MWGYLIAGMIGAAVCLLVSWLWKRGERQPLAGYSAEQAEKERERITGYAESERDKVADTADKARGVIDDY